MYLESIELLHTSACLAEPGKVVIVGKPSQALDEVLPYLATLPNIIAYNPELLTLTFRRKQGFLTLYSDKVYITQVTDAEEGLELLAALVEAINTTWQQRDQLVAVTKAQRTPRPLDVWALLPQTNCKECGEATCMAFAFALLQQKQQIEACTSLQNDVALADRLATLKALVGT